MKRIQFFCVAATLLLTGTVRADLEVHEYLSGQKVTLDTNTGHYWVWDLDLFSGRDYITQMSTIAALGTYGNIDGGWHMAALTEMQALMTSYGGVKTSAAFNPTDPDLWMGRVDQEGGVGVHLYAACSSSAWYPFGSTTYDAYSAGDMGAWVTSVEPVVPVPGALLLAATGLLSSTLGLNRLRRKR